MSQLPKSYTAWLTITRGCQLRCDWCYAQDTGFCSKMSDEVLEKSLAMFKGLGVKTVCIIGGEPTIDPRFLSLIARLRGEGYHASVITNGVRLADERFVIAMRDAGVGNVIVSLKAESEESYLANTKTRAFGKVMRGLQNLKKYAEGSFKYTLSVTLCGSLRDHMDELMDVIIESGATNVSFDTERPIIVDDEVEYDGPEPHQVVEMLVEAYPTMQRLDREGIDYYVYITHPFCMFPRGYIEALKKNRRIMSGCQLLSGSGIIIDENGVILPCNHFCKSGIGSVLELPTGTDYLQWRQTDSVSSFYAQMAAYPKGDCRSCDQWGECGAGCRIQWFKFDQSELSPRK